MKTTNAQHSTGAPNGLPAVNLTPNASHPGPLDCPDCGKTLKNGRALSTHRYFMHRVSKAKRKQAIERRLRAMAARRDARSAGALVTHPGPIPKRRSRPPLAADVPSPVMAQLDVLVGVSASPTMGVADVIGYLELKRRWTDELIGDLQTFTRRQS